MFDLRAIRKKANQYVLCVWLDKLSSLNIFNNICGVMGKALFGQCFKSLVIPFNASVTEKGNWHPANKCNSFMSFM